MKQDISKTMCNKFIIHGFSLLLPTAFWPLQNDTKVSAQELSWLSWLSSALGLQKKFVHQELNTAWWLCLGVHDPTHMTLAITLHTKSGHMFRNSTVHVKFTSINITINSIFVFTFKLLMYQSFLIKIQYLGFSIFWHIPLTRFGFCASSKGHVQWHWAPQLAVGIWKGQNPSHATRCFVGMVMVEPHPSNPRWIETTMDRLR